MLSRRRFAKVLGTGMLGRIMTPVEMTRLGSLTTTGECTTAHPSSLGVRTAAAHQPTAATPSPQTGARGVSDERFARLTRGINLSHWFAQAQSYDPVQLRGYITADDIRLIKATGFAHVRLPLEPTLLLNANQPDELNRVYLDELDAALDMILAERLAVIVDIHPGDGFKLQLGQRDDAVAGFAAFWRALAQHLAGRDPELVFLEVLNEPVLEDAPRWAAIQRQILAAMRVGAPRHTLIATAHRWSGLNELLTLAPVDDPNVVYNFHRYDPHTFTHQGATWGTGYWPYLAHLPYPSSPEAVATVLPSIADEEAKQAAIQYGQERWDAAKIETHIARAAAWAKRHGVRLTCNEFGVYRPKVAPADRNAWIHDVRTALERHGIGWAMWDYAGGFSVVITEGGRRVVDAETATALGLAAHPPPA